VDRVKPQLLLCSRYFNYLTCCLLVLLTCWLFSPLLPFFVRDVAVFSQLPQSCGCVLKLDLTIQFCMNATSGNIHKVRQFPSESIFLRHVFDGLLLKTDFHLFNQRKKPIRCHLLFYCTSYRFNMFRALLRPSSGARDYDVDYHISHFVLGLFYVGG